MRRRRSKRIWYMALGVFVAVFLFTFLIQRHKINNGNVLAASLEKFDPGYIISDYQMGNYNSMSEEEIQAFLTKKNSCPNTNYNYYLALSANPNYTWHFEDGHFVCLSEEKFGDGEVIGSGETAAHIIWQAAQDYQINPQVLIVLLQKETSLITDPIPNNGDYRKATGYGCPDTAPCSSQYYGFKNQVRKAAALFHTVLTGGWTNYPLGNNYVQYNPNAECGGSIVNIRSLATSALYRYTPYQPNEGALAAGYGTAYCGAYGNRNFYLYFEDWFGGITDGVIKEVVNEAESEFEQPIDDGTYRLYPKVYSDKVIDIKGGLVTSGGLQTYQRKTTDAENQIFEIKYDSTDGFYNIINAETGSAFDVKGAGTTNSTPVNVFPLHSNCNQDWLFEEDENGYYQIISRCSSRVLDAAPSGNIVIFDNHDGDNQKWMLVKVENDHNISDGKYFLNPKQYSDKVIDIRGGLVATGKLQTYQRKTTDAENQIFEIKYDSTDGFYNIINAETGSAFDVKGAGTTNSTPVNVFPLHSNCNQDWLFEEDENGYYQIISRCSSRVLDAAPSGNIVIFDNHGGDNQKWMLVKANE